MIILQWWRTWKWDTVWWEKSIEEIDSLIPILTCSDLEWVKAELRSRL